MQSFQSVLSRLSWVFFNLGCYGAHYLVFRPSGLEFLIFCVVEGISLWLTFQVDKFLFPLIHPETKRYFPKLNLDTLEGLEYRERESLIRSLMRFPLIRGTYCWFISYLKVIPTNALVVVFVWKHDVSNFAQFAMFMAIETIWYAYLYGVQYIELHQLVSKQIDEIHKRFDWSDVFDRMPLEKMRGRFELQEFLSLTSIWVSLIILQVLLVVNYNVQGTLNLLLLVVVTSTVAYLLMARIWYVTHQYFFDGLGSLFGNLEAFDPAVPSRAIPLWSSYQVARFQRIFNQMMSRLRGYDEELSHWITTRAEQTRYEALGELSSLVVHDLTSPLHVIDFCAKQIEENPGHAKDPRYITQLTENSDRALELVQSLRAHIRNKGDTGDSGTSFSIAATHVLRLLRVQFSSNAMSKVRIDFDSKLSGIQVRMSSADLVHVLMNILQNGMQNLIDNGVANPKIQIDWGAQSDGAVAIHVLDNGTGLSPERFEELTAILHRPSEARGGREGLGLRLVRRLLERAGGEIRALDRADEGGTEIQLVLPLHKGAADEE